MMEPRTMERQAYVNVRVNRHGAISRRGFLRAAGIAHFFNWVTTSVDAGCRKPDPNFFKFALQQCGLRQGEVLFVGNQLNTDVCGGVECGIRTVWISGEAYRSPEDTPGNLSPAS